MSLSSLSKLQRLSRRAPTAGPPPVKGERSEGEALALDKGVQWRSTAEGRSGSAPAIADYHSNILWSLAEGHTRSWGHGLPLLLQVRRLLLLLRQPHQQPHPRAVKNRAGGHPGPVRLSTRTGQSVEKPSSEAPVSVSALTVHPPGLTSLSTKVNALQL